MIRLANALLLVLGCAFAGLGYLGLKKPRMQAKPLD
jgi:hypothetical protein